MNEPCRTCGQYPPVRFISFWTDPTSRELSASRFIFWVMNIIFLPILVTLAILYDRISFAKVVELVLGLNAAPTIVYGVNSAMGAWSRSFISVNRPPATGITGPKG